MKISFFVLLAIYFATLVDNSLSNPLLSIKKRTRRSPQFVQNYAPGSQSQNFNCQSGGGCGNIGGLQNIRGSHVSNHGLEFRYVFIFFSNLQCLFQDCHLTNWLYFLGEGGSIGRIFYLIPIFTK